MSLADNIAEQFIEAISRFTPEYVDKLAKSKAAALRLTEPEQKARDEYNATIVKSKAAVESIKSAELQHDAKLSQANDAIAKAEERHAKAQEREDKASVRETSVKKREDEATKQEISNKNYRDELDRLASSLKVKEATLKNWESELTEQANSFEQAQKLIKRK